MIVISSQISVKDKNMQYDTQVVICAHSSYLPGFLIHVYVVRATHLGESVGTQLVLLMFANIYRWGVGKEQQYCWLAEIASCRNALLDCEAAHSLARPQMDNIKKGPSRPAAGLKWKQAPEASNCTSMSGCSACRVTFGDNFLHLLDPEGAKKPQIDQLDLDPKAPGT